MVAGETKLFMRASSAIFQNVSSSGSRRDLRFGKCPQKKSLPVVPTRKAFLEAFQEKSQKNNSAQVGQNFQNQLPDNLSGIKTQPPTKLVGSPKSNFCPTWAEVKKPTSTQVVLKSRITSTQLAEKSGCNFYSDCVEVKSPKKKGTNRNS